MFVVTVLVLVSVEAILNTPVDGSVIVTFEPLCKVILPVLYEPESSLI